MASGFFGVTGARHFELGVKARTHNGIERLVLDLHAMGLCHPLAQCFIRGKAFWTVEDLLQAGAHRRRERDGFAGGDVGGQQGVQPPSSREGQPAIDGVAMHPEEGCHLLAV